MNQPRTPLRRSLAALSAFALAALGVVATAAPAHAATLTVTTTLDAGAGSLRQAIIDANSVLYPGADTITFQAGLGTIVVTSGSMAITETVTISGPGASDLTVERQGAFDLFTINNPQPATDFTIEGLTILSDASDGSGIVAFDSATDVRNVTVTDTVWGGFFTSDEGSVIAVYEASGALNISGSTFDENAATLVGGAVYADLVAGAVSITNSTFEDNQSVDSDGGAVWTGTVGSVQISGSTFEENFATGRGGALYIEQINDTSLIELSDFTNNSAGSSTDNNTYGGSIYIDTVQFDQTLTIRQSSVLDSRLYAGTEEAYGAGLYVNQIGGEVLVDSSTFARGLFLDSTNAPTFGSGLSVALCAIVTGELNIINSTFDEGPTLDSYVIHACEVVGGGAINISYSTLVGPGILTIEENEGSSSITSSILDASTFAAVFIDNQGNPADVSWSLFSTALNTDYVTDGGGNTFNVADPLLGPLQNNGGPTPTRLLLSGSPALDAGNPAVSGQPAFDQRGAGFPRVTGRIDIGAIEMPRTLPATGTSSDGAVGLAAVLLLIAGIGLVVQGRRAVARRGFRTTA